MMTFATNSDVETRIKGGTDALEAVTESTPYSADKVTAAREKAHGLILGKVGVRYAIPGDLSGYPALQTLLREFELDLVEFELWTGAQTEVPKATTRKRGYTWKYLCEVADGTATLPAAPELPATDQVDNQGTVVGPERVMTRDDLDGVF